jgi:nickel/cobalt exporter
MRLRVALAAAVTLVLAGGSAEAHPLGLPAFAQISGSGNQVAVTWIAAPDDVAALARSVGLGGEGVLSREQDASFSASDQLRDRVLRDVAVRQDDGDCEGTFAPPSSVVTDGVRVTFRCPETVHRVTVRIALLHDVDSRYRTLASAGESRAMHTVTQPEHDVRLDPDAEPAPQQRAAARDVGGAFGGALPLERRFVAAIDSTPGVLGLLLALLIAFAVGALHALAPGHGKAVAAGYLIGERARLRHAVVLGVTVAVMHTGSVLALGLALYSATRAPDAARLSAAIGLVTGLTFAALGLWLLVRRWRTRSEQHAHHDGNHDHAPEQGPLSVQGVVALGAAGGLLPSPSALLVLLTSLAVGRVAYGLSLIAAFSAGLAMTVTLVGVAVLRGRDVLHDRAGARLHRLVHAAPLLGATAVTVLGATLAITAALKL